MLFAVDSQDRRVIYLELCTASSLAELWWVGRRVECFSKLRDAMSADFVLGNQVPKDQRH